jgi:hypothetical protein
MLEGYDVDTPRRSSAPAQAETELAQVVLKIAPATCGILEPPAGKGVPASCRVTLGDREISAAELPERVRELLGARPRAERVLFLAADDRLNYEGVLRIVDLAKSRVDDLKIGVITTE